MIIIQSKSLWGTMILAGVLACMAAPSAGAPKPLPSWVYLQQGAEPRSLTSALAPHAIVCVTGLRLHADGKAALTSRALIERCRQQATKGTPAIYPLVTADVAAAHRLLHSTTARGRAVSSLRDILYRYQLPGLHLDLEYLPPEDVAHLALFLKELKAAMPDRAVTMAVFPSIEMPERWHRFHDLSIIGPLLDAVVLMCYDWHRPDGPPGPVTGLAWAEASLRAALKHVKHERLWLGIPAYGYAWPRAGSAMVLTARQASTLTGKRTRDHSGTLFIEYRSGGRDYRAWVSDRETRASLQRLAARYGLAGTALWRLGFEE